MKQYKKATSKKKYSVTFLFDPSNNWFSKFLNIKSFNLKNKFKFYKSSNPKKVSGKDLVFILNYTKILKKKFLKKNKLNLVIHSGKLPIDKGFAPMQYQILRRKKNIDFSLFKANEKVDTGEVYIRSQVRLKGGELLDELREIQGREITNLIKKFLIKYPNIKGQDQKGKSTFNKKRTESDSKLNINKSLKSQFNLMRIAHNDLYPSFFYYRKKKYIIKIYKEK